MPDVIELEFRIGTWVDEAEGRGLKSLGDIQMLPSVPSRDEFIQGVLDSVREAELEPWAHRFTESSYYANAAGEGWTMVVDLAPLGDLLLEPETGRTVLGAFLGALFARILKKPYLPESMQPVSDAAKVTEIIQDYMIRRDNLAPDQISEISLVTMEDGSYESIVRRETDNHGFLFRVHSEGYVSGRIDLTEVKAFVERHRTPSGSGGESSE